MILLDQRKGKPTYVELEAMPPYHSFISREVSTLSILRWIPVLRSLNTVTKWSGPESRVPHRKTFYLTAPKIADGVKKETEASTRR